MLSSAEAMKKLSGKLQEGAQSLTNNLDAARLAKLAAQVDGAVGSAEAEHAVGSEEEAIDKYEEKQEIVTIKQLTPAQKALIKIICFINKFSDDDWNSEGKKMCGHKMPRIILEIKKTIITQADSLEEAELAEQKVRLIRDAIRKYEKRTFNALFLRSFATKTIIDACKVVLQEHDYSVDSPESSLAGSLDGLPKAYRY